MKKWMYTTLIIMLAVVFLASAGLLIWYFSQTARQQGQFDDLAQKVENARPTRPTVVIDPTGTAPDETEPTVSPWVELTDPDGKPISVLREYAELYEINPDLVGWMTIEGTVINYPVMQNKQVLDYYLYRDFYKKSSGHGCIYVREACDVFSPSDNLTIYGHRKNDGTMFADLAKYRDKSFYEAHPYIVFDTISEHHTYQIISVFRTTASVGEGFAYHEFVDAFDAIDFREYVETCKELAYYETGVSAEFGDKLISLSTCEFGQVNGRIVVVAKRIS